MPRNVRNAWADVTIDGRKGKMAGGPRARDGGMHANVYVRDRGIVARAVTVDVRAEKSPEGDMIVVRVFDREGDLIHKSSTLRDEPK